MPDVAAQGWGKVPIRARPKAKRAGLKTHYENSSPLPSIIRTGVGALRAPFILQTFLIYPHEKELFHENS